MATFVRFQDFIEKVHHGEHDLETNQLVVALTNTAPTAGTDTQLSDLTEITYTNVSGAGQDGRQIVTNSSAQTSGTYELNLTDLTLVASGGSVGPFRYVVIYNDDATNDLLIGYADYGSSITLNDTETFTIDFDDVNGLFQAS